MIIAINGYIGSGKDTIGNIIQYQTREVVEDYVTVNDGVISPALGGSSWRIKKFAEKLKQVASLLTGIPREKFEDQEFKKTFLSDEWSTYKFKARNGEYYHFGTKADVPKYNIHRYDVHQMTVREFLQKLGTEAIRNGLHTNAWVNALFADYIAQEKIYTKQEIISKFSIEIKGGDYDGDYEGVVKEYPNWIITDCRFPNEAQAVKDRDGFVVRVNRFKTADMINGPGGIHLHPSETSLDNWEFDYVIDNNGTLEELTGKVKKMLEDLNIKNEPS